MVTNGTKKAFAPGIHVPVPTFFEDTPEQEIDYALQNKHDEFMIESGLPGIVLAGSTGEAVTLSTDEKVKLVKETKALAQKLGRPDFQVTLGCSGQSTRDVIAQVKAGAAAGADFVLALSPSYFACVGQSSDDVVSFFQEVASASPVPLIIYNWPGVANGIDVNSDMLDVLGEHPNIVAIKLTCGAIAKVARVAAKFDPSEFVTLAGQSDWLVPALAAGAGGAITGLANFYPKTCIELQNLFTSGQVAEAKKLQAQVAAAEWVFPKCGLNGLKWACVTLNGYPAASSKPRRPYGDFTDAEKQKWITGRLTTLQAVEAKLGGK